MLLGFMVRWFFVGIVVGVASASFFVWVSGAWVALALAVAVSAVWSRGRSAWCVVAFCVGVSCGMWRTESILDRWRSASVDFQERFVDGEARVLGEGTVNSFARMIPVRFHSCESEPCPREKVLIQAALADQWRPGETMRVSCSLELPENRDDSFDYRMYLAKEGVGFICRPKAIEHFGDTPGFRDRILLERGRLEKGLSSAVPEPENGLLQGLIFGGSDRLSRDMRDRFARTGLSHIVAVSGYNVMLVAQYLLLAGIAVGLWRKQAFWVALTGVWLFVVVTGAEASAVRAGIMGTLGFVALQSGRLAGPGRLFSLAAGGMLLINPLLLRYDIGFQLSFLATATLIFVLDRMRFSRGSEESFGSQLRETVLATLLIEIVVAPILLINFGFASLVSIPANALVLPIVPVAMMTTFLGVIVGLFIPAGINIFAWLAYGAGSFVVAVVRFFSDLPWATVEWQMPWWAVLTWYGILGTVFFLVESRVRKS